MAGNALWIVIIIAVIFIIGFISWLLSLYKKALQGEALVITGYGGTKVSFTGTIVVPVIQKMEIMDITLKTIMISRTSGEGLICMDNMRADIKVTFFIRVNQTLEDVKQVAQSIGCDRASNQTALESLFEAKFSEALKTVGKQFDFVELYNSRDRFKKEILNTIGTDLNGYVLDDCAIDYLEQTPMSELDENNILDAEGIKKIIDLTSVQKIEANYFEKEKEKTLTKQNVEARETVLELERQLATTEAKQAREVATIRSREEAETEKVRQEERKKEQLARIATEEEVNVAEENKLRETIVAEQNKLRTEAIETERVEKARQLESTERERVVELAQIEKEKALEEERKLIQDVIRDRIAVEKTVVQEEEKIKDTRALSEADRNKTVALINAERDAEASLVKQIKDAEAKKQASEHLAKQKMIDAQSTESASIHEAQAKKTMADAIAAEQAAIGISEAQVMEAKAAAREKQGDAEAAVLEARALADAKGIRAKGLAQAEADEKIGLIGAKVLKEQGTAEADAITKKGEAMQKLDGVGRDHEEFKLQLDKNKIVELAEINVQKEIAMAQASVIAEALKEANIEIIGGETKFFEQIVNAVSNGKATDRLIKHSEVLTEIKDNFFQTGDGGDFKVKIKDFVDQFGFDSEDVKNMSIAALLFKLSKAASGDSDTKVIEQLSNAASSLGLSSQSVSSLGIF